MGSVMKLIEAVGKLDSFDNEATIYAATPWTENSEAIVAREPTSGGPPTEAEKLGLKYFLEVFVARDFLDGWSANLGATPAVQQRCSRLIQYVLRDV
jgi:hypothetical protein